MPGRGSSKVAESQPDHPGASIGLPATGRGSLAPWRARVVAIVLDWAICMALAVLFFGTEVLTGKGWRSFMILTTYVVESILFCTLASGSIGQLICRIAVVRLDRQPLGLPRAALRAVLMALALPALVIGAERRHLADMAAGTVVVNRS